MIILTIPYKNPDSILPDVSINVDYIEYRLDYCSDISQIDWNKFTEHTILTIRDKSEGGNSDIPDVIKCSMINEALVNSKAMLDVEFLFLLRNHHLLIPQERLIISLHTKINCIKLISQFAETALQAQYYKLAVSCKTIDELSDIACLLQKCKAGKYILIPLNPCSVTARMLYKLYGSCGTYVYYNKPVVKNQLSLNIASLCRIDKINDETYIYAIIGKKQVLESLSLYFYNKWFYETNSNRVFIPIVAHTVAEAISMVKWLDKRAKVKGIAVTMPFKQQITPVVNETEQVVNSWFPEADRFCNTDSIAFEQAISKFRFRKSRRIIIYGRGATAQTAWQVLKKQGYTNVKMLHRDNKTTSKTCKILINCTPFGLKRTDNPDRLPEFNALIDLPYGKKTTTLVRKAIDNHTRYIDGYMFWEMQAKFQAAFFGLEPEFNDFLKPYDLALMSQ